MRRRSNCWPHMLPPRMPKILFITTSNLGDAVLTTPVLQRLIDLNGEGSVSVMAGAKAAPLFQGDTALAQVIVYDKRAPLHDKIGLLLMLRRQRFDQVVDMRRTLFPLFILGLRAIPPMLRQRRKPGYAALEHWQNAFGESVAIQALRWRVAISDEAVRKADALLFMDGARGSFVGLAPGAASDLKRWPLERFAKLANRLQKEMGAMPVFMGADAERGLSAALKQACPQALDLIGKTDVPTLAAVLKRCEIVLTNDSGPMHIAAALGIPVVSLFGPTDAARYAPAGSQHRMLRLDLECSPCKQAQCPLGTHACMRDLTEETVWKTLKESFLSARTA